MGFFSEIGEIKEDIVSKISLLFGNWAKFVFNHTYTVILFSLILFAISCIGFIPPIPKWIDGAENLYSLPVSVARDHKAIHMSLFKEDYRRASFVIIQSSEKNNENIFTWHHLREVEQLDKLIRGKIGDPLNGRRIAIQKLQRYAAVYRNKTTTLPPQTEHGKLVDELGLSGLKEMPKPEEDRGDASKDILTFQDICLKVPNGRCAVDSVLEMGVFEIRDSLLAPGSPPELYMFEQNVISPDIRGFVPSYLMGNIGTKPCRRNLPRSLAENFVSPEDMSPGPSPLLVNVPTTCIVSASAFMLIYSLQDIPEYLDRNLEWEKAFIEVLKYNKVFGSLEITLNSFRSRDDELRSSTSGSSDILFVILTFIIIISYSTCLNFSCDLFRSKSIPALAGAAAAFFGFISGFGVVSLFGVAFVPTALICPFLVMGIGVDDMFVIVNSFSLTYTVEAASQRVALSLKDSGLSITITTITNLIAFGVGSFSPYLSIRNFCYFSAAGLAFGYVYCLTFFLAFLCLDARREQAKQVCIFNVPLSANVDESEGMIAELSTFSLVSFKARISNRKRVNNTAEKLRKQKEKKLKRQDEAHESNDISNITKNTNKNRDVCTVRFCETDTIQEVSTSQQSTSSTLDDSYTGDGQDNKIRREKDGRQKVIGDIEVNNGLWIRNDMEASKSRIGNAQYTTAHEIFLKEPKGNVGREWRKFFLLIYGPLLTNKYAKILVIFLFTLFFGVSLYGMLHLKQGLNLADLSPARSYLRDFDINLEKYFSTYDVPVEIFFPHNATEWWKPEVQESLRRFQNALYSMKSTEVIINPLLKMIDDRELNQRLQSGTRKVFEYALFNELLKRKGKYGQFEKNFIWQGNQLIAYKFLLLPTYLNTSSQRAQWMTDLRKICEDMGKSEVPLLVYPYNYMMIFYESDEGILSSVILNMGVATVAMLLVAFILIPHMTAAALVISNMILIDTGLFGFMYYWDVNLNMVSMINLVISVGFAVDYSAHMCHTFTHCEGETRNLRTIETLVLMGNPVFHGAISTLLGVVMLGFSTSYIFSVFFKMFLMVVGFGIMHGIILLPVILSLVGTMSFRPDVEPLEVSIENQLRSRKNDDNFVYMPMNIIEETAENEKSNECDLAEEASYFRASAPPDNISGRKVNHKIRGKDTRSQRSNPESYRVARSENEQNRRYNKNTKRNMIGAIPRIYGAWENESNVSQLSKYVETLQNKK